MHMQLATQIVASLLALEAANESQDIQLYINSQGKSTGDPTLLFQRQSIFGVYMQTISSLTISVNVIQAVHHMQLLPSWMLWTP